MYKMVRTLLFCHGVVVATFLFWLEQWAARYSESSLNLKLRIKESFFYMCFWSYLWFLIFDICVSEDVPGGLKIYRGH